LLPYVGALVRSPAQLSARAILLPRAATVLPAKLSAAELFLACRRDAGAGGKRQLGAALPVKRSGLRAGLPPHKLTCRDSRNRKLLHRNGLQACIETTQYPGGRQQFNAAPGQMFAAAKSASLAKSAVPSKLTWQRKGDSVTING
jgi:hypothetical protein